MKTVPHLFAAMTALLEDLHGLAVEGQGRESNPNVYVVLVSNLRAGLMDLDRLLLTVSSTLEADANGQRS